MQEVPKGTDRTPQRCFYFWNIHLDKAIESTMENVLKSLVRLRPLVIDIRVIYFRPIFATEKSMNAPCIATF